MERFAIKLGDFSIIALGMVLTTAMLLGGVGAFTDWDFFSSDVQSGVQILDLELVDEFPLSAATEATLLGGGDLGAKATTIDSVDVKGFGAGTVTLSDRLTERYRAAGGDRSDLRGIKFAMYVDVPKEAIERLAYPSVYAGGIWSQSDVFVDGRLVQSNGPRSVYSVVALASSKAPVTRVTWVFANSFPNKLAAFGALQQVSLRSSAAISESIQRLGMRTNAPHIIAGVAFVIFGAFAIMLAVAGRGYVDLWAFSGFCFSFGLYCWSQTPMFYSNKAMTLGAVSEVRHILISFFVVCASIMTAAFFRFPGRDVKVREVFQVKGRPVAERPFFVPIFGLIGYLVVVNLNYGFSESKITEFATSWDRLLFVLIASQLVIFGYGFYTLLALHRVFTKKQLLAQRQLIRRRILIAVLFAACMGMMIRMQIAAGVITSESGSQTLVTLAPIFPAFAMLMMFAAMTAAANRFYSRFAPRLGQIDHEIMAFGATALEKRYQGTLFVFDVAGMKALNELRMIDRSIEAAVDQLVSRIEHDLGELVQSGRTTFRYKSNGDEFIFAMWAKDVAAARSQFVAVMRSWLERSPALMAAWKSELAASIGAAHQAVVEGIDMHVLACVMHEIKITVKGGIETPAANPDFVDARFTKLSALFKPSKWNSIAVYADDARLLVGLDGHFEAAQDGMGFWTLEMPMRRGIDLAS